MVRRDRSLGAHIRLRMDTFEIITRSPAETEALGAAVGRLLPRGAFVALRGDLASGKTCFVRGVAAVLAGDAEVSSPTFTLVNEYPGPVPVHHLDLYRLSCVDELADLGVEELFEGDGISLVEWAERAGSLLPAQRLEIHFEHAGGDQRRITLRNHGLLPSGWREALRL